MRKVFSLVGLLALSSLAVAQSSEAARTRNGQSVQSAEGVSSRLNNVQRLEKQAVKGDMTRPEVTVEKLNASISTLEKEMAEREASPGFNRDAYEQRLALLRARRDQLQSTK